MHIYVAQRVIVSCFSCIIWHHICLKKTQSNVGKILYSKQCHRKISLFDTINKHTEVHIQEALELKYRIEFIFALWLPIKHVSQIRHLPAKKKIDTDLSILMK